MRMFGLCLALAGAMLCGVGCSKTTVEKAGNAVEATGDAIGSAAEDAAENVEKMGDEVKEAVTGEPEVEAPATEAPAAEAPATEAPKE